MNIQGKVVVVTGAASGIGKALAERFSAEGAQALILGDVDQTVAHAQRSLERAPEDDDLVRGGAAALLGLAAWRRGDRCRAR